MAYIKDEEKQSEKYWLNTEKSDDNQTIAKLTTDNVAKALAMIKYNSAYNKALDASQGPSGKYIGSSAYWCEQLKKLINDKKTDNNYSDIIENIIKSINNENSTHLNSDGVGFARVKYRILNAYKTPQLLIDALKNIDSLELFNLIAYPKADDANKTENNHPSFASKFCHYLAFNIFEEEEKKDSYVIYDEVIRTALPMYVKRFLGKNVSKKDYEGKDTYKKYREDIMAIAKMNNISNNGFDQLVWYFHKS